MALATERIYKTREGVICAEGDPEVAFLAYAVGDELSADDEAALKNVASSADKAAPKPADKAVRKPREKKSEA